MDSDTTKQLIDLLPPDPSSLAFWQMSSFWWFVFLLVLCIGLGLILIYLIKSPKLIQQCLKILTHLKAFRLTCYLLTLSWNTHRLEFESVAYVLDNLLHTLLKQTQQQANTAIYSEIELLHIQIKQTRFSNYSLHERQTHLNQQLKKVTLCLKSL